MLTGDRTYRAARHGAVAFIGCAAVCAAHIAAAQPLPPQGSPLPGIVQPSPPPVAPPTAPAAPVSPTLINPEITVDIRSVTIEGSTAYGPGSFAAATAGLIGPAVQAQQIEVARAAILNRYRSDGFVYITVNARIIDHALRFLVTEGRIVDVKLDGNIGLAGTQVLRFLRHLTELTPIDTASIERWLLLAGDVPGVSISVVLNPSSGDPGALTLQARVQRTPVSAQLQGDNRAFRQTGPEELLSQFSLNSFTSLGEVTQLSLYHTFNNTETFGQMSEDFFLGGSGLRLHIFGGAGETNPSGTLGAIGYDGITRVGSLSLSYPLIRARRQTLNLSAQFDVIESEIETNTGLGGKAARASFDSLRVFSVAADYALYDILLGPSHAASTDSSLRLSQGLPILGASANGASGAPRLNEREDFTKVTGSFDRTQSLFTPFAGGEVSVRLAAEGQFSRNILPPAEEFYLGGPHFTRGFYYGEVTGDSALALSFEPLLDVRLGAIKSAPAWLGPLPLSAQFYTFADWGQTWQNQSTDANHTLRSLGGGVRLYAGQRLEMDVEAVSRLTRSPNGDPSQVPRLKSSAVYWQVIGRF